MRMRMTMPLWKFAFVPFFLSTAACVSDPKSHFDVNTLEPNQRVLFAQANVILLGEQHDNPTHHKIQNDVLETLGEQGRLKSIVFEQIDWTQQGVLDQLTMNNIKMLPTKIEWEKSGWPDYSLYEPLIATAVRYRAKVIAGGLPKNRLDLLYKTGYEGAFTAPEIERLRVRNALEPAALEMLHKDIYDGHCKMIPEDQVAKMVPIQRARDAAMIRGYQNEADLSGVTVFILGSGHARKEFGVPTLLKQAVPKAKIWSVGMQEEGAEAFPASAFDKVWVTEALVRPDPCEQMKKHVEGIKDNTEVKGETTQNKEGTATPSAAQGVTVPEALPPAPEATDDAVPEASPEEPSADPIPADGE